MVEGDNGRWKYKSGYKGKAMVILQANAVSSKNPDKPPAILELNLDKVCNHGIVEIMFLARSDGYVAVLLQYLNQKSHIAIEVYGFKRKQCMLRKVIEGKYHVLEKNFESCGYSKDVWHTLAVKMTDKKIDVYLGAAGAGLLNVMSFKNDEAYQNGKVALATFETIAAFTNMKIYPIEDADMMPSLFNGGVSKKSGKKGKGGKGGKGGAGDGDDDGSDDGKGDKLGGMDELTYSIDLPDLDSLTGSEKKFNNTSTESNGAECSKLSDPKDQYKYCVDRFENDKAGRKDCTDNFCDRCCSNAISETKPLKRFNCVKECKGSQKPLPSELYKKCAESPSPGISSYKYCQENFQMEEPRMRCKIDFCNLCCTMGNWVFHINFDNESINKCHKKCIETFTDSTDTVIDP